MKEIQLSQGKTAQVDDEDFDALNQHKWHARRSRKTWYARRNVYHSDTGKQTSVYMHCEIYGAGVVLDHWDNNGLNNQRYNLRPATNEQNQMNTGKSSKAGTISKYKGVSMQAAKCGHPWYARIQVSGKGLYLGSYKTEVEAAKAYDAAAVHYFGEFARLNFPVDKTPAVM